ncbi:hypothetical protein BDF21DRAFT_364357 [Thamnidium elegans]|uniref:TM7S3/TM198-like domain-containing protein n=1 Tax=Thamnidium elegans TaxID=101142 RepID=A0A8H7SPY5_9FUNG|nr:hypothetical protein INT48_004798 [Thamnidium elegans]KAI8076990.1 hypothetical protein BDF21DRAFT_364357 [Thamnidium elegans]
MKYNSILKPFFIALSLFIVVSSARVIDRTDLEDFPTRSSYYQKRDVVDFRNSGSKTTSTSVTTTATATSKPTNRPKPTSAPSSRPEDIYGGVGITAQNGVIGALLIVLGLYLMVFGFRSFRITLGVCGFLTFGLITWVAMANNQPYYGYVNNDITIIAVPFGLGILGAIIYALFWNISIYLVGALGGFTLAMYILCCKVNLLITQVVARAALLVALPFFISFVTFFAEQYVLLFTFAFVGSYCFIVGVEFLAHTGYLAGIKSILDGNPYHQVVYVISRNVIILIAFIPILFLISFGWQFMYNKGQKFGVIFVEEKPAAKAAPKDGPGDPGPVKKDEPHIEEKA